MFRHFRSSVAVALLAYLAGTAAAAAPGKPAAAPPAPAAPADTIAKPAPVPDTPMAREIRAARAKFQAELARLTASYNAAATPAKAQAVQRAITALKAQDEIDVLAILARYARAAGLTARAQELDSLLARLRARVPDGTPPAAAH